MEEIKLDTRLQNIFKELGFKYNKIDLEDEDCNYKIEINTSKFKCKYGVIEALFYCSETLSEIGMMVGNIYRIRKDDDMLKIYDIINDINKTTDVGRLVVYDETITYIVKEKISPDWNELTSMTIRAMVLNFIKILLYTFDRISEVESK